MDPEGVGQLTVNRIRDFYICGKGSGLSGSSAHIKLVLGAVQAHSRGKCARRNRRGCEVRRKSELAVNALNHILVEHGFGLAVALVFEREPPAGVNRLNGIHVSLTRIGVDIVGKYRERDTRRNRSVVAHIIIRVPTRT